jgi:hypothetical protein
MTDRVLDDGTTRLTAAFDAPCGCVFGNIGDAFVCVPCSLVCPNYLYFRQAANAQGKPVEVQVRR